MQVWRPLTGPVEDSPLGLIDGATVGPEDVMPVTIHLNGGMTHEVSYYTHNPDHRCFVVLQKFAPTDVYMRPTTLMQLINPLRYNCTCTSWSS